MTTVINLYGGPGTGKSTSAAYLFYQLKKQGKNAELVREYVKDWAWEKREIRDWDQLYFLGKQIRRESLLYGRVDTIVTDAPVALGQFYAEKFSPPGIRDGVKAAVQGFYKECETQGIRQIHVFLNRSKAYNPAGRFQTEEQAKEMDMEMLRFLRVSMGVKYWISGTQESDLEQTLHDVLRPE